MTGRRWRSIMTSPAADDHRLARPILVAWTLVLASLAQAAEVPAATGEIRLAGTHAVIRGRLVPATVSPGETARLELTASPDAGYKIYALGDEGREGIAKPTLIRLLETSGLNSTAPTADRPPNEEPEANPQDGIARYYKEPVTWTIPIEVPAGAAAGPRRIEGVIAYQICFASRCEFPTAVRFDGALTVADGTPNAAAAEAPLNLSKSSYSLAEPAMISADRGARSPAATGPLFDGLEPREFNSVAAQDSLVLILAAALLGGLILNFMPCVLPVIGLKVLSFVNQADNRAQAFLLNVWFSAGLISVFLVLASLAAFAQLGWGEQFSSTWFNVAMIGLVFAMALSFLGIWEIPIPGFVGTAAASNVAMREGAIGAFSKGVVTTILSTPCSGPFLGPVFGFTLKQTAPMIFLIFFFVGLGMASPYLLIGAFPRLVRFLPKPGAWMETFKQIMGFFLLGTVVFLFTFTDKNYLPAVFCMLVGIWFGCWWIGRTPLTVEFRKKLTVWAQATGMALLISWMGYYLFIPRETAIRWQPFSRVALEREVAQGNTVLVDFTADWCPTCKVNERLVLNTEVVSNLVNKNRVVALVADWTDGSEEIKEVLEQLRSRTIPIYAIFPADRPKEPIVLRDLITKRQVLAALNEAGPSRMTRVATAGR